MTRSGPDLAQRRPIESWRSAASRVELTPSSTPDGVFQRLRRCRPVETALTLGLAQFRNHLVPERNGLAVVERASEFVGFFPAVQPVEDVGHRSEGTAHVVRESRGELSGEAGINIGCL